jgi:hypothetical protein
MTLRHALNSLTEASPEKSLALRQPSEEAQADGKAYEPSFH